MRIYSSYNGRSASTAPADPNASAPNQPAPADPADPAMPALKQPALNQPVLIQPALAAPQIIHQTTLNWSHFKPEFSGRPEEDVKTHLLHTNNWMETHNFQQGVKVKRFCLALIGEAGLWYESLRPIVNDWPALQEKFGQQYSKVRNTREQLFHAWRSSHYDENTETVGVYVNRIRQVAAKLGHGEPQILEFFLKIQSLIDRTGFFTI